MSSESNPASDWSELVEVLSQRFGSLNEHVQEILRVLLDAGRRVLNCAESALLVPTEDETALKFLVSVNSKPELADVVTKMTVPCEGSVVGCVFNTGQFIAIANPDPDEFYQGVNQKTGLSMNVYLVTPVVSGEEIVGIVTFMNRPEGQAQEPFDQREIEAGTKLADLAASCLKYHRRMLMQQRLFQRELIGTAARYTGGEPSLDVDVAQDGVDELVDQSPLARAMLRLESMSRREQDLAADLIGVLSEHAHDEEPLY